jgi:hypothetical protein
MTLTAHVDDGYDAYDIAVSPNGTVFLANGGGGLRAYAYDGSSLTSMAWIDDPGTAYGVALASSGTVFLAHGIYMLAYNLSGTSFTQLANIMSAGSEYGVAVGPDGTVFLACLDEGLRAFNFNGSSFVNTANIDNGGRALHIAVDTNGTVFLANEYDGLRAYTYDGSSFTNTAHVDSGGKAQDVALGLDGTVFLANGDDYLRAFTYDGASFTHIAHYSSIANDAMGIAVSNDNTVFVSHETSTARGGMWAFVFDGSSFTWASGVQLTIDGFGKGIAIGPDGTVFLASSGSGLYAFSCSDPVSVRNVDIPVSHTLKQNYPNPFNPVTTLQYELVSRSDVKMIIYDLSGRTIKQWTCRGQQSGLYDIYWNGADQNGNAVPSGIYIYLLIADKFTQSRKMLLIK